MSDRISADPGSERSRRRGMDPNVENGVGPVDGPVLCRSKLRSDARRCDIAFGDQAYESPGPKGCEHPIPNEAGPLGRVSFAPTPLAKDVAQLRLGSFVGVMDADSPDETMLVLDGHHPVAAQAPLA